MANYYLLIPLMLFFSSIAQAQSVPEDYRRIAQQHQVPPEALYSLALTESATKLSYGTRPWPWTINVAGRSYYYPAKEEAYQALQQVIKKNPLKQIDVGIAQVNLGWNGHRFSSYWQAFDPYINLAIAAQILRECYDRQPGSWFKAVGCYHRPAGGKPAQTYQAHFNRHLNSLNSTATQSSMQNIIWLEPIARKTL